MSKLIHSFALARVIIIENFLFYYDIFLNAYKFWRGLSKNLQVLLLITLASIRENHAFFLCSNFKSN